MFKVIDHINTSYRQTIGILATRIHSRKLLFHQAHAGISAGTPFFTYDATLLIDLLTIQRNTVRPIMKHQQTGVYNTLTRNRRIHNHIHSFIKASIGIQILAKTDTDCFQIVSHHFSGKIFCSVKSHMLQKMS